MPRTAAQFSEDDTFEIEQDGQWIISSLPQPDPNWTATDSNGHQHAYQPTADHYPTLRTVYGEPYWCDDCDDEHADSWYECRECGEKITPGSRVDTSPKWIGGPTIYRLNGEEISPEQAQELLAAREQAQNAARIAEAREKARPVAEALRAEGLSDDQVARVINRLVHGDPERQQ